MNQIVSMRDFETKLIENGLLIPKNDENAYCRDQNLTLDRLENGIRILTAQRITSDERTTYFDLYLLSGSYFDPKGMEGAHHFMEHLFFSRELNFVCDRNLISYNASTSQSKIHIYNNGIYNTKKPDFGVLNGIRETIRTLIDPSTLKNPETFQYFKDVIYREISEYLGNYQSLTNKAFFRTIFEADNPYAHDTLGTEESVKKITEKEISEIIEKRVVTKNMVITVLCDGEGEEANSIKSEIKKHAENFPRIGEKAEFDLRLYSQVKKLSTNTIHSVQNPIKNNLVTIFYAWVMDVEFYSEEEIAFLFLTSYLRNQFFTIARDRGLGYTLDLYHMQLFPNKLLFVAYLVAPSNHQQESQEKLKEILYEIFNSTYQNKKELDEILEIEHNRQEATPISQNSRLQFSLSTLVDFNLLTNNEAVRKLHLSLSTKMLQKVLRMILDTPPFTVVIGDV